MNKNYWKLLLVIIFVVISGICYSCSKKQPQINLYQEASLSGEESKGLSFEEPLETSTENKVFVHICGQVINPGIYELREGDRIFQAVEAAGGFTEKAASDYINMAQEISDGMKLVVPDQESLIAQGKELFGEDSAGGEDQPAKVNLNTASKEELMTLRGIGEQKALDIIHYRETKGDFQEIEDIKKISGIKDAAFQKIKDDITVE